MSANLLHRHCLQMARYNKWAFEQLFNKHLINVKDEHYFSGDAKLAFNSIHGTLCHLLLADMIWNKRFRLMHSSTLKEINLSKQFTLEELNSFWTSETIPTEQIESVVKDRKELQELILTQSDNWIEFLENDLNTDEKLMEKLIYSNTSGKEFQRVKSDVLDHVFNHTTHHRGQISSGLTFFGYKAPALDLSYFL
ncbi:hypothetical protein ABK040_015374 [Willaertia magna]